MKFSKKTVIYTSLLIGSLFFESNVFAGEESSADGPQNEEKQTGQFLLKGSHNVGQQIEQAAKEANTQTLKATKTMGEWIEDVAKKTGEALNQTGNSNKASTK